MCNIPSRIKEYIDFKGISNAAFEKSLGMSNGSFGKQLRINGSINSDKLENILKIYDDLSPVWLLTGKGSMLVSPSIQTDCCVPKTFHADNYIPQTAPEDLSGISQAQVRDFKPRIPLDAAAGSLSIALSSVSENECELMPIIPTLPEYSFTILARGDSMTPDILSGDELACRFINEKGFIQWGRIHVLDTAQGVVVKRIFDANDTIICRSSNSNYPDFSIPKDEIYHLAIVVGLVRQV